MSKYQPYSRLQRVLAVALVVLVNTALAVFIDGLAEVDSASGQMAAARTTATAHG